MKLNWSCKWNYDIYLNFQIKIHLRDFLSEPGGIFCSLVSNWSSFLEITVGINKNFKITIDKNFRKYKYSHETVSAPLAIGKHWVILKINKHAMGLLSKEPACQGKRCRFHPWVRKILWRRKRQPIPVFLPVKSHGQRSLVNCSRRSCKRVGHDLATKQQSTAIFKMIADKDLRCSTWRSALVAARVGGSLGENGYMYVYDWVPSRFAWNCHNIVNQLYPSEK